MLQMPLILQYLEIFASSWWKNNFIITVKQIKMDLKKTQLEEIGKELLASFLQWPEALSVKEHFCYLSEIGIL